MPRLAPLLPVLGCSLLGCSSKLPAGDPERPDIVLISIDSLRADHLGAYGYSRPTSPRLDALAARGLRFTSARAGSPWTLPSHMTMLTGLWPTQHHVIEDTLKLAPILPVVPERLRDAGYATGAFVSTIYVSHTYGFDRGFDRFEDYDISEKDNLHHPVHVDRETADAWSWASGVPAGKPIFLFIHIYDTHYPYLPPEPYNSRFDPAGTTKDTAYRNYEYFQKHPLTPERLEHQVAQYDEGIAWVDDQVGALVDRWEGSGRKVTWVVTADHGEELGERGSWGHGHTLYAEALHIPLIVAGAGIAPAVREDRVGTIDIAATLAGLAGQTWTGDGRDLRSPIPDRPFYAETSRFDSNRLSLLDGDLRVDLDFAHRRDSLYDVRADPGERNDLAVDRYGDVERLQRQLFGVLGEAWTLGEGSVETKATLWQGGARVSTLAPGPFGVWPPDATLTQPGGVQAEGEFGAPETGPLRYDGPRPSVPVKLDDATRRQLEALGYVQGDPK